jgi:hypothetical protein
VNRDKASAGLLLIAVAVYGIIWFYRRKQSAGGFTVNTAIGPATMGKATGNPLSALLEFARQLGLRVTSTTGGEHNTGSLHYQGRAIDVGSSGLSDSDIDALTQAAAAKGIKLRDERARPPGQAIWGGPHLHLEVPF